MMQQQQMEDDQRWLEQEESFMVIQINSCKHRDIHTQAVLFRFGLWTYYEKNNCALVISVVDLTAA